MVVVVVMMIEYHVPYNTKGLGPGLHRDVIRRESEGTGDELHTVAVVGFILSPLQRLDNKVLSYSSTSSCVLI